MELLISKKYLTFPVNTKTVSKKVCLFEDGTLIFDLDCKLDMINPDFTAYVDVERFKGKRVTMTVAPQMDFLCGEADAPDLPGLYSEPLRPQIHFTVPNGWNNDPNGLIYTNGKYHMFYQYNPCSAEWGNMHWGHAVSTDLLHWENRDIALFPDETGTMYSGSAIEDKDNIMGLKTGETTVMLLFYTAAGDRNLLSHGKKRTQCLAFSCDGGRSFTKYSGNPVVDHIEGWNRDPKVVFVPELDKYIMALFLNGNRYMLLSGSDFIHWEPFCELTLENEAECPDIYPLYCNGEKKWVIEGASNVYIVGHFEKDGFVIESREKKLSCGKFLYAAQSFSGLAEGDVIKIFWERTKIPGGRFSQQMSIPVKMQLENVNGDYFLSALPFDGLKALQDGGISKKELSVGSEVKYSVGCRPLDIALTGYYDSEAVLKLSIFGHSICVDMKNNLISAGFAEDLKIPVSAEKKVLDLRIIVDRGSVEIFADGGKSIGGATMLCDYNLPRVTLSANKEIILDSFDFREMKSIW